MSKSIRNVALIVALIVIAGIIYWYLESKKDESSSNKVKPSSELSSPEPIQNKSEKKQAVIKAANSASSCEADPKWFPHNQTARTNDAAFQSTSNCVFHQWAWQNFLWLTQEVNGQPRFMGFKSPESLLGLKGEGMLPRMLKKDASGSFEEFLQAGTDGILIGHNGRAVYYSQYLDDTFS